MKIKTLSKIKKEAHKVWSLVVRSRDFFTCQWCGKESKSNHAHHIVSKGCCNPDGATNQINGVTLCYRCHMFRLKADPDAYIAFRDIWLQRRSALSYLELRAMFTTPLKWKVGDYQERIKTLQSIVEEFGQ